MGCRRFLGFMGKVLTIFAAVAILATRCLGGSSPDHLQLRRR